MEYAVSRANELDRPVIVGFGLFTDYPEANERYFAFVLEDLADMALHLRKRVIQLAVRLNNACLALAPVPQ